MVEPLVAGARPAAIPLSPAQRRMWFINRFDPSSAAYNIPFALTLRGTLDIAALRDAVFDVIVRHETLRTVFTQGDDGVVAQQILDPKDVAPDAWWTTTGVSDLPALPFDVTVDVPIRAGVVTTGPTTTCSSWYSTT